MAQHRPDIFVSAVSADLRTCRQLVKDQLLTLGCVPVEQANFPPDAGSVREMLHRRIEACDMVIHIAGLAYGAEPRERAAGAPRRSYTQLEFEIAESLAKPVVVFVCGDAFPYDPHEPEDETRRQLQRAHRERLQARDHLFEHVLTREQLAMRVLALRARVQSLEDELALERKRSADLADIVRSQSEQLEGMRRLLERMSEQFSKVVAQEARSSLTPGEVRAKVVERTAHAEGVTPRAVEQKVAEFAALTAQNPQADAMDRALAAMGEGRSAEAVAMAEMAVQEAVQRRDAVTAASGAASEEARAAVTKVGAARLLQGRALIAAERFDEAIALLETAIEDGSSAWGTRMRIDMYEALAQALGASSWRVAGDLVLPRRQRCVDLMRELAVAVADEEPVVRAAIGLDLAMALEQLSGVVAEPALRATHLAEAWDCCQRMEAICVRESMPQLWGYLRRTTGCILLAKARMSDGQLAAQHRTEAVVAHQDSIEVFPKVEAPDEWAVSQGHLGDALWEQAFASSWTRSSGLLEQVVTARRHVLEVITEARSPVLWATVQGALCLALSFQAMVAEGSRRRVLVEELLSNYDRMLGAIDSAAAPQVSAGVRLSRSLACLSLASGCEGVARVRALDEAVSDVDLAWRLFDHPAFAGQQIFCRLIRLQAMGERTTMAEDHEALELLDQLTREVRSIVETAIQQNLPCGVEQTRLVDGVVMLEKSLRDVATRRMPSLDAAEDCLRHALDGLSREANFEAWSMSSVFLAQTIVRKAEHEATPQAMARLDEAEALCRSVLELQQRESWPSEWSRSHDHLAQVLRAQARRQSGAARLARWDDAAHAYRLAMQVRVRQWLPHEWAMSQFGLSDLLVERAQWVGPQERKASLQEAVDGYRSVLEVHTREHFPFFWRRTQRALAQGLTALADAVDEPQRAECLRQAEQIRIAVEGRAGDGA